MYADDAALFLAPARDEVQTLAAILNFFGEVTGLKTNFLKSTVIPIRCQGVDLTTVLNGFEARRASFPIKYLGLPLSTTRLKNVDFQPVVDKVAGKLNTWGWPEHDYGWETHPCEVSFDLTDNSSPFRPARAKRDPQAVR